MSSLYALTNEFQQLANMDAGNDEDFAAALADTLDAQSDQLEDKIEATIIVSRQLEADAEACKAEAKRLTDRARAFERNAKACKDRVLWAMETTGRDKIKRQLFTITRAKPRPVVEIDDEALLPSEYVIEKVTRAPDKKALLEALKAGEVAGAHLGESKPSLRVS